MYDTCFAATIGCETPEDVVRRSIFDLAAPSHLQHVFACVGTLLRSSEATPRGEIHGALADSKHVISITLIRPSCFTVSLVETLELPAKVVG